LSRDALSVNAARCVVGPQQAKCFRLTHAFFSIGSLYLGIGLILSTYFPVLYAQSVALSPASWKTLEPLSTLIGSMLGGIMGAED
jgi:hypothetical protein